MCGIVGYLEQSSRRSAEEHARTLKSMASQLASRGPDGEGIWMDPNVGVYLGHRRLSIVDLSAAGAQPMVSHDGRYVIILNGEIYNFVALRDELEKTGSQQWRGHSDTEILLEAIVHWGPVEAIRRCVGMFAFALWDRTLRKLTLGRDRVGEKPLYYGWSGKSFLFASELKAFRTHPEWLPRIDPESVRQLTVFSYISSPASIFIGIRKLMPGTLLQMRPEQPPGAEGEVIRYWSLQQVIKNLPPSQAAVPEARAIERLDELLRLAVSRQMVADVPVGAFLSGGIDSSLIVAMMQAQSSNRVQTFTIGFRERGYDEAEHARRVAEHLGTSHCEMYVEPADALDVLRQLPALYDEPHADSSQLPTYLVARLARQSVTVSLSGDGGDELFCGYNHYFQMQRIWNWIGRLGSAPRKFAAAGLRALAPTAWDRLLPAGSSLSGDRLHKLSEMLDASTFAELYESFSKRWNVSPTLERNAARTWWGFGAVPDDALHRYEFMMAQDFLTYLPDSILSKVDRAAMGVSLETRLPLLDRDVVEFAWQLPLDYKVREGRGKWLLRRLLARYLPAELLDRPKAGFAVPVAEWLRGPLREWAENLLDSQRLREGGFFDPVRVRTRWLEHLSGSRNWGTSLWNVLVFQAWFEDHGRHTATAARRTATAL